MYVQTQLQKLEIPLITESSGGLALFLEQLHTRFADYKKFTINIVQVQISQLTAAVLSYIHLCDSEQKQVSLRHVSELVYLLSRMLLCKLAALLHIPEEKADEEDSPSLTLDETAMHSDDFRHALNFLSERDRVASFLRIPSVSVIPDASTLSPQLLRSTIAKAHSYVQDDIPYTYSISSDRAVLIDRCIKDILLFLDKNRVYTFSSIVHRTKPRVGKKEFCTQFFAVLSLCSDKRLSIRQTHQWQDFTLVYA